MEPIDDKFGPQQGPQEKFLSSTADIAIYGGAAGGGKSAALLLEPLRNAATTGFNALVLRRTLTELKGADGLWGESETVYSHFNATQKISELTWKFESGATIKFAGMEHEKDKLDYQGRQFALIEFDELTHFTETQFWYMISRNRSTCGVKPYIRASCNPDVDSFVAKLIEWWIDQDTGYPIPERSGAVRWFVRDSGELKWSDTKEEIEGLYSGRAAKSLTFIAASLEDNKILTASDPNYIANLQSLPFVEQERLLKGNWKVRPTDGFEWPEWYFGEHLWTQDFPPDFEFGVIAVDHSRGVKKGDYGASVFVGWTRNKFWVDSQIRRRPIERLVDEVIDHAVSRSADLVYIEGNGAQYLVKNVLDMRLAERAMASLASVVQDSKGHKEDRMRRLGPRFQDKQFVFLDTPDNRLLIDQCKIFPHAEKMAKHDDGPDTLEMSVRALLGLAKAKFQGQQNGN